MRPRSGKLSLSWQKCIATSWDKGPFTYEIVEAATMHEAFGWYSCEVIDADELSA